MIKISIPNCGFADQGIKLPLTRTSRKKNTQAIKSLQCLRARSDLKHNETKLILTASRINR